MIKRPVLFVLAPVFLICSFSFAQKGQPRPLQEPSFPTSRQADYAPDSILVRYRAGHSAALANKMHASREVHEAASISSVPGLKVLKLPASLSVQEAVRLYSHDADVLYAEPDYKIHVFDTKPNDPLFPLLWAMQNTGANGGVAGADISATKAWSLTTGSASVAVGIIDTGGWPRPEN